MFEKWRGKKDNTKSQVKPREVEVEKVVARVGGDLGIKSKEFTFPEKLESSFNAKVDSPLNPELHEQEVIFDEQKNIVNEERRKKPEVIITGTKIRIRNRNAKRMSLAEAAEILKKELGMEVKQISSKPTRYIVTDGKEVALKGTGWDVVRYTKELIA